MKRYFNLPIAIGLIAILAACASEVKTEAVTAELAPLEARTKGVGDTWVWKVGDGEMTRTVTSVQDGIVSYEQSDGCSYSSASMFAPSKNWSNCDPFADGSQEFSVKGQIYPLAVGNSVSFPVKGRDGDGNDWSTTRVCTVKGTARVTVPAGAFDTYHVTCNDEWNNRDLYIAPDNGELVLYRQLRKSRNQVIQRELISFTAGA